MHPPLATPLREQCPEPQAGLADVVMRDVALDPEERAPRVDALGEALEADAGGVVTSPEAPARDSATQLRYLRVPAKLPSQRLLAPPRAHRDAETSGSPATIALQAQDLFDIAEPPPSFRRVTPAPPILGFVPRRPPPCATDTARLETPKHVPGKSVRKGLLLVSGLLAIGLLASLAQPRREAGSAASSAPRSLTLSLDATSPLEPTQAFRVGTNGAGKANGAASPPQQHAVESDTPSIPFGKEPPALGRRRQRALTSQLQEAERARSDDAHATSAPRVARDRADGAAAPHGAASMTGERPATKDAPGDDDGQEAKPIEANPYLRR